MSLLVAVVMWVASAALLVVGLMGCADAEGRGGSVFAAALLAGGVGILGSGGYLIYRLVAWASSGLV